MYPTKVMVLKLSKKALCLQFWAGLNKKCMSVKKQFTCVYLKGLFKHFQKMVIVHYAMTYCFGNIRV